MGAKHKLWNMRVSDNFMKHLEDLCSSYGLSKADLVRKAVWEMPSIQEKKYLEEKQTELETNVHIITQEHVRLRTFILAMGNYIKKLEKENGAPENSYLEQMVKDYPVLYDYAVQMTVENAELN